LRPSALAVSILATLGLSACGGRVVAPPPPEHMPLDAQPEACGEPWVAAGGWEEEPSYERVCVHADWLPACLAVDDPALSAVLTESEETGPCSSQTATLCEVPGPEDACCYVVRVTPVYCVGGRPFVDEAGEMILAPPTLREGWVSRASAPTGAASRERLAAAWLEDALFEHASVASFARHALELLAVGAPAELVRDALRAADDEVEHARLCFALASRYAGSALGPGALPIGRPEIRRDLGSLAEHVAREGCINETVAAHLAEYARVGTTDAAARAALERIAEDEAAHARLAWRTLRWAIARGGDDVRARVQRVFAELEQAFAAEPRTALGIGGDEEARHGQLSRAVKERETREAILRVVLPCARGLFACFTRRAA